jgi:hypothetical protein
MLLKAPFMISSRLLPAIKVEGMTISLTYSDRPGDEHRTRYWYALDFDDGTTYEADDLQSGNIGDADLQYGFENLLGYLEHAAESYRYHIRETEEEYEPVFTEEIDEELYCISDEIGMLRLEVEETPGLIEESAR